MKVLVIAPHMDDEVLGLGGTIARRVAEGDDVLVCCVANRAYGHQYDDEKIAFEKECAQKAKGILGYKELRFLDLPDERLDACLQDIIIPLEKCVQEFNPQVAYVNHRGDNNQDHRAVFEAALVALRPAANAQLLQLISYETPSSTEQAPALREWAFLPDRFVNVEKFFDKKIEALACYETEKREGTHPRSPDAVRALAQKRGVEAGFPLAESFVTLRERWP